MTAKKTQADRFWAKVDKDRIGTGCWMWIGGMNNRGYGVCYMPGNHKAQAHRIAYTLLRGEIPAGLHLDHLCRETTCVNPGHLEPVTCKENVNRGLSAEKHRLLAAQITHCPRGHPYAGQNLYVRPTGNGNRSCRACHREHMRKARERTAQSRGQVSV